MGLPEAEFVLKVIQWLIIPALVWCWRLDRRLTQTETQSADLAALYELSLKLERLTGEVREMSGHIHSLDVTVKRQQDYLLNMGERS